VGKQEVAVARSSRACRSCARASHREHVRRWKALLCALLTRERRRPTSRILEPGLGARVPPLEHDEARTRSDDATPYTSQSGHRDHGNSPRRGTSRRLTRYAFRNTALRQLIRTSDSTCGGRPADEIEMLSSNKTYLCKSTPARTASTRATRTSSAGASVAAARVMAGRRLIAVVRDSPNMYADAEGSCNLGSLEARRLQSAR